MASTCALASSLFPPTTHGACKSYSSRSRRAAIFCGIQLHRFFEFLFYFPRVGKTAVAIRFAAVDSAQPLMVNGIFGIERDGLLGCRNRIVIIVEFVIGASQPVVSLRAVGILRDGRLQRGNRRGIISRVELPLRSLNLGRGV